MGNIGFIGLGRMGSGICKNLIDKGHCLAVYDVNPDRMRRFEGTATLAQNIQDVFAWGDTVFLSLPDSDTVENVVGKLLQTGAAGKTVIDLSTSYPLSTKMLYEKLKAQNGNLIDAPLNSGPDEAEAGTLISMVAGDKETVNRLHDVLMCYCKHYTYIGGSGSAHTAKLVMNSIGLMYALLLAQMFPMAEKLGLDTQMLYQKMDNEIFGNWLYRFYGPKIVNRTYDQAFSLELGLKDLTYMKKLFEACNTPAFALDGGLDLLRIALKEGKGKLDFCQCAATMYEFLGL